MVIGILLIVCLYTIVFDGFWICIPLNLNQYFIIDTFLLLSDKLIIDCVVDELHLLLRITDVLIENLFAELYKLDHKDKTIKLEQVTE